jgi:hypothetical protein
LHKFGQNKLFKKFISVILFAAICINRAEICKRNSMTPSITKLPDEPIVIVTIRLPLHEYLDDIAILNEQVAQILATTEGPVYRISDGSKLDDIAFSDILLWLGEQRTSRPGSVLDSRVIPIAVGSGRMAQAGLRKLAERTGVHMPLFETLEEAVEFARAQLAQRAAS